MLAWLYAGHLIGDYLFQTKWMAINKDKKILPLFCHSAVYACAVWFSSLGAGGLPGLDWRGVLFVLFTHMILDNRRFVMWWCRYITQSAPSETLRTATDQAWHTAALALACYIF